VKRRTMLTAMASAPLTGLALSSCGETGLGDGPITLEYWAWNSAQKPMVEAWNATHPDIQVRHTDAGGGDDSANKLVTTTRAGNAPDVALVEYPTLPSMIVAGVATEISEHVEDVEPEFREGIWSQASFDGQTYGIPQDAGPQALTYNRARFEELGVDVPTTWEDFATAAQQVREADPETYIATFAPAEFGGFAGFAQQAGAIWWEGTGATWRIDIDGDKSTAVADYWQDLIDQDLVTAEPVLTPEWNAKLNRGQILSFPAGLWGPGVIGSIAGDMAGDWAIAPLPQWTPGDDAVAFQGGSAAIVTTSSRHPAAAAQFASWLATSEDACEIQIQEGNYPASTVGQELTLDSPPPTFMTGQVDYWELAAQIAANTLPESTWGPNVNVASTAFEDAMSAAVTADTPLADALSVIEQAVVTDMTSVGYTVKR